MNQTANRAGDISARLKDKPVQLDVHVPPCKVDCAVCGPVQKMDNPLGLPTPPFARVPTGRPNPQIVKVALDVEIDGEPVELDVLRTAIQTRLDLGPHIAAKVTAIQELK